MIGLERLGVWITKNPVIIIAVAVLLTLGSVHYAQQIESQGMTTETFVSKDSALYQLYDHLYQENFGSDGNMILIEGDDVAKAEVLSASLRLSDHMKQVEHVAGCPEHSRHRGRCGISKQAASAVSPLRRG